MPFNKVFTLKVVHLSLFSFLMTTPPLNFEQKKNTLAPGHIYMIKEDDWYQNIFHHLLDDRNLGTAQSTE